MTSEGFLLTKIIATLGPASSSVEVISQLIGEGVRVFRINFSHGSLDQHAQTLSNIRRAEKETGKYIGVLGDLSGPKIRIGEVVEGGIQVAKGERITFIKNPVLAGSKGNLTTFSSTLPSL